MTELVFAPTATAALKGAETVLLLAPQRRVQAGWIGQAVDAPWARLITRAAEDAKAGRIGRAITIVNPEAGPRRIVLGLLPDEVSRHNAPSRLEFVGPAAAAAELTSGRTAVLACAEAREHVLPLARAVGRAIPLYSRNTSNGKSAKGRSGARVSFVALDEDGRPVAASALEKALVHRARWAASLVDAPTSEMDTAAFEKAVRKAARGIPHLTVQSIVGPKLLEQKLGGLHAVGRAASVAPRLLLLRYAPPRSKHPVALIGKGIVYDTGGLSLKPTSSMCGMKADMGGAAAAVGATLALAETKSPRPIVCAAALAENAIGPTAYRPDDILTFHSGKTVEINNTDAEGRLVLADAVSYVARKHRPAAIVEAATLTGAQLVATGTRHAAIVSNREGLERLAFRLGRETGDLTFPLPFSPEFFQEEFKSKVADMKNSVANRMNAQSSCAAQFIYSHIEELDVPWLHVDLAGPAFRDERATGYGVALLANVAAALTEADLAS